MFMKELGYPVTWPIRCFINGGCGADVFAHTNGFGDFVLFDNLGWPWPVYECYASRFLETSPSGNHSIRVDRLEEYRTIKVERNAEIPPPTPKDISRVEAAHYLDQDAVEVMGYVQDIIENRVAKLILGLGGIGRQQVLRELGTKKGQITIITDRLQSFSAFADLRTIGISKKDTVMVRLKPVWLLISGKYETAFVCHDIEAISGHARER